MIEGVVNDEGEPIVTLTVGGRDWTAVIDTGFNGDLQLPEECRGSIQSSFAGQESWVLANNQVIEEDTYLVELSFDGDIVNTLASFVNTSVILVGTGFLRDHRLTIDFVAPAVRLERVEPL